MMVDLLQGSISLALLAEFVGTVDGPILEINMLGMAML